MFSALSYLLHLNWYKLYEREENRYIGVSCVSRTVFTSRRSPSWGLILCPLRRDAQPWQGCPAVSSRWNERCEERDEASRGGGMRLPGGRTDRTSLPGAGPRKRCRRRVLPAPRDRRLPLRCRLPPPGRPLAAGRVTRASRAWASGGGRKRRPRRAGRRERLWARPRPSIRATSPNGPSLPPPPPPLGRIVPRAPCMWEPGPASRREPGRGRSGGFGEALPSQRPHRRARQPQHGSHRQVRLQSHRGWRAELQTGGYP